MTNNRDNGRPFCVVQFKGLPYEGIGDYVCVPQTWIIERRATDQRAVVAYPKDEDPFVTRDRVKRKEIYNDKWSSYVAIIKYESDTFNDADYWIDTRNNCGSLLEEDSIVKDAESTFFLGRKMRRTDRSLNSSKLMSFKRPAISKLMIQNHKKRAKLDKAAQSSMTTVCYDCLEPGCSKNYHSIKMQDNQPMANAQKEETGSASYDEQSTEQYNQTLSLPLHVDNSIEDTTFDAEDLQDVEQPYQTNISPQSNLLSNTRAATVTAPKLLITTEQKCQAQIADVQYVVPVYGKHKQRIDDILNNGASTSNHPPNSVYDEHEQGINDIFNNRASTSHHPSNSVYDEQRNNDIFNNGASTSHHPPNSVYNEHVQRNNDIFNNGASNSQQHPSLLMSAKIRAQLYSDMIGGRKLVPTQQTVERQIRPMHIDRKLTTGTQNRSMNQKESLSKCSVEEQSSVVIQDQLQHISQVSEMQIRQNMDQAESNNQDYRPNVQSFRIKSQQNQPQRPKLHIDITLKPKRNSQHSTIQEVAKKPLSLILSRLLKSVQKALSVTHKNDLNKQDLQASSSMKSNEHNSTGLATSSPNIAASATHEIYKEIPTCSFYQSPRTQHTENGYQNLSKQTQLVDQSTDSNLRMKQEVKSPPQVMDNTCQTEECIIKNSQYHEVTFDTNADMNNEEISNQVMSSDEIPAETINSYSTGIDTGNSSGDRPTSAQNSTPTSHQTDSRVVRSNVSHSSNVTPEIQQTAEDRPIKVNARKKKHNNLWQFELPPNYDPHNSRWTLKYPEYIPGLIELTLDSHIYVSYGDINYCQQISKDCKSLARRLLHEVFNQNALSVCSSMTEKAQAQASNNVGRNVRPVLAEHANTTLINFVRQHGLQCGWNIDLQPILDTLHIEIQKIRFRFGKMVKC